MGPCKDVKFQSKRVKALADRLPMFKLLRKSTVDTARILRTGGIATVSLGQAITGVSPSHMLRLRRLAVVATAPVSGTASQNLDLALILADENRLGRADPAYDAHALPIVTFARAAWHEWVPHQDYRPASPKEREQLL